MGMPMELNTMIVTKGREQRIQENVFTLRKEGYRLYPMHIPLEVKRTIESDVRGIAEIIKVVWEEDYTLIHYQLVSLNSSN